MNSKQYANVTSWLFVAVFLVHGTRFVQGWDLVLGPWNIPLWVSGVGAAFVGYLAWNGWKLK